MKQILILFCVILLFKGNLFSQKEITNEADLAYESQEFFNAIELYKKAYSKAKDKDLKADIIFKTGVCYMKVNDPKNAEAWFKKAVKIKYHDAIAQLYLADMLKVQEKYDEALIEYENYQKLVPNDARGPEGVKSCKEAVEWKEKPTRYEINNVAFFNSRYDDFCPAYAKKDYTIIYFSSSREGATGGKTHGRTGQYFADIYESKCDRKGKWSEPVPLNETVNTEFDEGSCFLNDKGSTLYFTRCKVEKKKKMGCQIYMVTKKGVVWGDPEVIPIAADSLKVGHPSLSADESVLYFSAELEGGYGGKDIWMVQREKKRGNFGAPVNLGPSINTPGDEMFPYIHDDGTLYFSSNGRGGMGGLDIYKAKKKDDGTYEVFNMRYPINSASDDFGIIFETSSEKGYFTSNRSGGKGGFDIYSFVLPPLKFTISGIIKDEKTLKIIDSAKVELIGSDNTSITAYTDKNGMYKFDLKAATDYILIASKQPKYLNGTGKETTKGLEISKDLTLDIMLAPIYKPIELPNIEYDLDKWDLRPEAMVALDKLVQTLNDNPNITIELRSHTDFRDTREYNLELSQKRAQSVVDYLIEKGIAPDRLVAKGYGEDVPNTVNKEMADKYRFLREGDVLTEAFIKKLTTLEEQEICHQINRRTEFQVLRTDYVPKKEAVRTTTTPQKPKVEVIDVTKQGEQQTNPTQPKQ